MNSNSRSTYLIPEIGYEEFEAVVPLCSSYGNDSEAGPDLGTSDDLDDLF